MVITVSCQLIFNFLSYLVHFFLKMSKKLSYFVSLIIITKLEWMESKSSKIFTWTVVVVRTGNFVLFFTIIGYKVQHHVHMRDVYLRSSLFISIYWSWVIDEIYQRIANIFLLLRFRALAKIHYFNPAVGGHCSKNLWSIKKSFCNLSENIPAMNILEYRLVYLLSHEGIKVERHFHFQWCLMNRSLHVFNSGSKLND